MKNESPASVRAANASDIPALLQLMHGLATFEKYADIFAVTEETLRQRGFVKPEPDFHALVAENASGIVGMIVFYIVPFTAEAVPALFIKELFVSAQARGQGIGTALMRAVSREAIARGCGRVRWQVARWNQAGMRFYERLGAQADPEWINYSLSVETVRTLAGKGLK